MAPIIMRKGEVKKANQAPAMQAIAKEIKAAFLTDFEVATPLATKRIGPTRSSSVPLIPSL
jgi:hypothetical protein